MSKENQEFFKLLKCSNELIKNKKSLFKEYPEKSKKLSQFLIRIEENLHLRQKNKYIELMEIFLTNQINAEDFSFYFIAKYDNINKDLREMERNFEQKFDELSNLLLENKNNKYTNNNKNIMNKGNDCSWRIFIIKSKSNINHNHK